jgi:nucleoside-diphosphate-sugar epimerase
MAVPGLRVAVLGGTGFVGKAVCREAVRVAPAVGTVLSLSLYGCYPYSDNVGGSSLAHYRDGYWPRRVLWRHCNLVDPEHLPWAERTLAGYDAIIHVVGSFWRAPPARRHRSLVNANLQSVLNALALARAAKVPRFVFLSASGVPPGADPEALELKRAAELAVLKQDWAAAAIVRSPLLFGRESASALVVGTAAALAQYAGWTDNPFYNTLHVDRLARCLVTCALTLPRVPGHVRLLEEEDIRRISATSLVPTDASF